MDELIQFQGEEASPTLQSTAPTSGITALVIRWGLARDKRQARTALLIVAVAAACAAIAIPILTGGTRAPIPWTPPPAYDTPAGFAPAQQP